MRHLGAPPHHLGRPGGAGEGAGGGWRSQLRKGGGGGLGRRPRRMTSSGELQDYSAQLLPRSDREQQNVTCLFETHHMIFTPYLGKDSLGLRTPRTLWGWALRALQGDSGVGHSRETAGLRTPGRLWVERTRETLGWAI